ncbi:META domain-containing protein [Marinobacterium weihaiense]|uniref:META domain-containing protein n=1 Tax=Marinobacterium weihaiense TaxID=2851016 RepID=A0ABS6M8F5_9GAMM|nr:META domain-containing protein [Marinobacterium weihaiense]MBV0932571.1 META domain-containing protein [Marinobacterium weihaiense]
MSKFHSRSGYLTSVLAATVLLSGCSTLSGPASHEVSGQALYRERIMLPPQSHLEVKVQDVSRADAPAEVLATLARGDLAAPPYDFSFTIPAEQIEPGHRYSVRAAIYNQDQLLFTTDQHYPVLAGEDDTQLMLVMKRVAREQARATLQNTYWKLISLNGEPVQVVEGEREPHLILKQGNRVQGFSGCNQFMGQFDQQDGQLSFGPIAGTMRACVPSMTYERPFLQLMQGQVDWSIEGETLQLNNPEQKIRARFKAIYLQ